MTTFSEKFRVLMATSGVEYDTDFTKTEFITTGRLTVQFESGEVKSYNANLVLPRCQCGEAELLHTYIPKKLKERLEDQALQDLFDLEVASRDTNSPLAEIDPLSLLTAPLWE